MILLTPGPCMTSETVRRAAAMPDLNHRDPTFIEMFRQTREMLLRVYPGLGDEWRAYLIGGSGTAAVEAMITSCVNTGPVLLIDSGYYSERMRSKLEAHEIPFEVLSTKDWLSEVPLEGLSQMLAEGQFEAVLTTHHETTVGRLHPIKEIGELCSKHGAKLLVDAMSSFGADEIDFTNIDAVASSANKCLHGLPGLSFVLVQRWLADEMRGYSPRTVYLSLPFYEGDSPPLTPPVPILSALRQALEELGPNGARHRRTEYVRRCSLLRDGLRGRGFRFALPEGAMSCTLTTASVPEGWTADAWMQANTRAGFMLYALKGDLRERWFQVANMGELKRQHLELWLAAVDDLMQK